MPIGEMKDEIYIRTDDGCFMPLTDIPDISLKEEDIEDREHEKFNQGGEINFEINLPTNYCEIKNFIDVFHPSVIWLSWWLRRFGSNNWRKLHGLPMRRRERV